jgi:hypothetical protein
MSGRSRNSAAVWALAGAHTAATTKMAKGISNVRRFIANQKHYEIQQYASSEHAEHRGGCHSERSEGYAFSIREIKQLHQMRKINEVKMV